MAKAKAELAKKFQIPTSALSFNLQEEDVSRALEASLMENPDFFKIVAVMHGAWIPERVIRNRGPANCCFHHLSMIN